MLIHKKQIKSLQKNLKLLSSESLIVSWEVQIIEFVQ